MVSAARWIKVLYNVTNDLSLPMTVFSPLNHAQGFEAMEVSPRGGKEQQGLSFSGTCWKPTDRRNHDKRLCVRSVANQQVPPVKAHQRVSYRWRFYLCNSLTTLTATLQKVTIFYSIILILKYLQKRGEMFSKHSLFINSTPFSWLPNQQHILYLSLAVHRPNEWRFLF